jgi:ubiquinone/menaquinone biosynthesis C-methylase UbiE
MQQSNRDEKTIRSFGDEWNRFDQSDLRQDEAAKIFGEYFCVFPWDALPVDACGFDMGCGTGRWAKLVAAKVGHLHCIDPSDALDVARCALKDCQNITFHRASVGDAVLPSGSQDFGYSLGVLHHVPDTAAALRSCVELLKSGAPFLLYLYYAFDNRSRWFRAVWRCSDLLRRGISRLSPAIKHAVTDLLAALVYFPLARACLFLERVGFKVESVPLSYYRKRSFYTMRTDSRDRFGTPLERRFRKEEIADMMQDAGLREIRFSETAPYWCAVGFKAS